MSYDLYGWSCFQRASGASFLLVVPLPDALVMMLSVGPYPTR